MKQGITIIAALAFGAAIAASPVFAQQTGKSLNDGGSFASQQQPNAQPLYNSVPSQTPVTPQTGKSTNDGGIAAEPSTGNVAATRAASNTAKPSTAAPYTGKGANDGGM